MRIVQAFSAFFKILADREFALRVAQAAETKELPATKSAAPSSPSPPPAKAKVPSRNEAVTLLATLQREARFVDIVKEPLDGYSDAQVGAATRDVLRECGKTLERLFAIRPLAEEDEGTAHTTPTRLDAARYTLTGNVAGEPPYHGSVVHRGWQVTRCELPSWSGSDEAAKIVAPVELEIK